MSPLALGGGPLDGDNIVREVWLDEAGIGDIRIEPWLVVGGILINPDKQWKRLEGHLKGLAKKHGIKGREQEFIFHGHHLFHNKKYFKDRDYYDRAKKEEIFRDFCSVPTTLKLPVIIQQFDRVEHGTKYPLLKKRDTITEAQAVASASCAVLVEKYMRTEVKQKGALVRLIYEQNLSSEKLIKRIQELLRDKHRDWGRSRHEYAEYLPLKRVVGEPMFSPKHYGSPHQVSDAIAFVYKRHISGKNDADEYAELFEPMRFGWSSG